MIPDRDSARRPRRSGEEVERALMETTLALLREQGFARMTVEAVAERSGIAKTTIYRRYRDKGDLVTAAIESFARELGEPPDRGDTRREAVELIRGFQYGMEEVVGMSTVGTLLVEEGHNPHLLDLFRERAIAPRRGLLRGTLERGVARRQVRGDADLDLAIDMLVGCYFARYMSGAPFPQNWADAVVAAGWSGLTPREG